MTNTANANKTLKKANTTDLEDTIDESIAARLGKHADEENK